MEHVTSVMIHNSEIAYLIRLVAACIIQKAKVSLANHVRAVMAFLFYCEAAFKGFTC